MISPRHRRENMYFRGVWIVIDRNPNGSQDLYLDKGKGKEHALFIRKPHSRRKRKP